MHMRPAHNKENHVILTATRNEFAHKPDAVEMDINSVEFITSDREKS